MPCYSTPASSPWDTNGTRKVYLDCTQCHGDFIREEGRMVEYVRDPAEADVHVTVTNSETGSGGQERAVARDGIAGGLTVDMELLGAQLARLAATGEESSPRFQSTR